ncbi:MAG: hypothetical protein VX498_05875 [Myxococcota bacterium]|nr:hypothetical protein [Myxococcota bacterium]
MSSPSQSGGLEAGLSALARGGINLAAHLRTEDCLSIAPELGSELSRFPGLLLLGSAGPRLWESLREEGYLEGPDPVDSYCRDRVRVFRTKLSDEPEKASQLAWPNPAGQPIAVTELGELAGWSSRSPLGLGIHPEHGLWFAYRAVLLLEAEAPQQQPAASPSPCLTCLDKPCVSHCPAGAVGGPKGLDIVACFT